MSELEFSNRPHSKKEVLGRATVSWHHWWGHPHKYIIIYYIEQLAREKVQIHHCQHHSKTIGDKSKKRR